MINDVGTTKSCSLKVNVSTVTHHVKKKKKSMVQTEYQTSNCHMISFVHYGCFYTGMGNGGEKNQVMPGLYVLFTI